MQTVSCLPPHPHADDATSPSLTTRLLIAFIDSFILRAQHIVAQHSNFYSSQSPLCRALTAQQHLSLMTPSLLRLPMPYPALSLLYLSLQDSSTAETCLSSMTTTTPT